MSDLVKSTFPLKNPVKRDDMPDDPQAEYEKKALEHISGSMVFVERKRLTWDKPK